MKVTDHPQIVHRALTAPIGKKRIREREAILSMALVLAHGAPPAKRRQWKELLDQAKAVPSPPKRRGARKCK